jgi:hypothetical protein
MFEVNDYKGVTIPEQSPSGSMTRLLPAGTAGIVATQRRSGMMTREKAELVRCIG